MAMLVLIVIARAAGQLPILHTLIAELFPTEIRTQAIGITDSMYLTTGALAVKFFPEMKHAFGFSGLCFFYAIMGFLNFTWGGLTIPDNRGKSLVKVEESYENKVSSRRGSII